MWSWLTKSLPLATKTGIKTVIDFQGTTPPIATEKFRQQCERHH